MRAAARVMGDGGRLIFTGSVLGERPRGGGPGAKPKSGAPRPRKKKAPETGGAT